MITKREFERQITHHCGFELQAEHTPYGYVASWENGGPTRDRLRYEYHLDLMHNEQYWAYDASDYDYIDGTTYTSGRGSTLEEATSNVIVALVPDECKLDFDLA